jgi:hypothetical protein
MAASFISNQVLVKGDRLFPLITEMRKEAIAFIVRSVQLEFQNSVSQHEWLQTELGLLKIRLIW